MTSSLSLRVPRTTSNPNSLLLAQCNAVIFVITVWKLTQKFSEINPDMKKLKKARVLTITAVSQLFLLGCTWIFGLFLFDPKSQVLAYAFTILTCLQGFFLFLLHCLLNKKVGFRPSCRRASTSLSLPPVPWAAPPLTWHPGPCR